MSERENMRERVWDIARVLLQWSFVTALSFLYWMAMLLIVSLVLLNVWIVSFETIEKIALVLMILTGIGYAVLIYRRHR